MDKPSCTSWKVLVTMKHCKQWDYDGIRHLPTSTEAMENGWEWGPGVVIYQWNMVIFKGYMLNYQRVMRMMYVCLKMGVIIPENRKTCISMG